MTLIAQEELVIQATVIGKMLEQVALGHRVYLSFCAGCHGAELEGQSNWKKRLPLGNFPAPPHDKTGHTWHHADQWLFEIVKYVCSHSAVWCALAESGTSGRQYY